MEFLAPSETCNSVDIDGNPCSCKKIADLENRLLEAEKLVATLKAERLVLNSAANASHDRVSGRLPLEIVTHIFKVYVDMHGHGDKIFPKPWPSAVARTAPLRLGAVCHTWRMIAWSYPQLWTTMALNICFKGRTGVAELAMQWMKRTGTLPLAISLFVGDMRSYWHSNFDCTIDKEEVISVIHTINQLSSRWRTLDLQLPANLLSEVYSLEREKYCNLQYLQLECTDGVPSSPIFLITHLPTHVSLIAVDIHNIDISWINVTDFNAEYTTVQAAFYVFAKAPCLTRCILHVNFASDEPDLNPPITNSVLHSLVLMSPGFGQRSPSVEILDSLTLPSLKTLDLTSSMNPSNTIDGLIAIIGRSACQLTSLTLDNFIITDDVIRLLQVMPTIKYLSFDCLSKEIDEAGLLFKFLSNRIVIGSEQLLLPDLETLVLCVSHTLCWKTLPDLFDPSGLTSTTENLQPNISSLYQRQSLEVRLELNVHMEFPADFIDKETLHRLSKLRGQGIGNVQINRHEDYDSNSHGVYDSPTGFFEKSMAFHYPQGLSNDS